MVSPICSSPSTKSSFSSPISLSVTSSLHNLSFSSIPLVGISHFSPWNGLKHLGISISPPKAIKIVRKGKCKGKVVYASFFGVGAPEALVIGVVALLVFGPKGLAEVARNLGKTLRAFQPTIRELQDVSREFKSTLEREIGLDEISSPTQNTYSSDKTSSISPPLSISSTEESQTSVDPNGAPSQSKAYTSEEYLKITEEQLKASAAQQPEQTPSPKESRPEPQTQIQATVQEETATVPLPSKPENET